MFLLRYAKNPKTRLRMETVYQMRCVEENTPRIEEMVKLRHKKAILLGGNRCKVVKLLCKTNFVGYPDHASYVDEEKMAKNPANVIKFLLDLKYKLQNLWASEKQNMLKLKESEAEEFGFEFDGKINKEDFW